jgi:hypothetical protein
MKYRIAITVLAGTVAWGLLIWPVPYNQDPAFGATVISGMFAGLVGGSVIRPGVIRPALAVAGGFALADVARIVVDLTRDATSHNLWPLELVFMGVLGFLTGLLGVGIARLLQRLAATGDTGD